MDTNNETITLTWELIDACKRNGAFTSATVTALGLTWKTIKKGWTYKLVGKLISKADYERALQGRNILAGKRQSDAPRNAVPVSLRDQVRDLQARVEKLESTVGRPFLCSL